MDRLTQIKQWLDKNLATYELTSLGADASFRRYFRVKADDKNWLLMDSPPDKEPVEPFVRIDTFLLENKQRVPQIYVQDIEQGFLLLEDFGDRLFSQALPKEQQQLSHADTTSADTLYQQALQTLVGLQQVPTSAAKQAQIPDYTAQKLTQECQLFSEWFMPFLDADTSPIPLEQLYTALAQSMSQQPQVVVHRDYHSRNLMLVGEQIGLIDFQDAVIGSATYDVASLVRDAYVHFEESTLERWSQHAFTLQQKSGVFAAQVTYSDYQQMLAVSGLQRGLKVLGIFVRLSQRDGKSGYLADLPRVMHHVLIQLKTLSNAPLSQQPAQLSSISTDQLRQLLTWFEQLSVNLVNQLAKTV